MDIVVLVRLKEEDINEEVRFDCQQAVEDVCHKNNLTILNINSEMCDS